MKTIVCGAGIAGLALASRLDTLGKDVVVLEQAPGPRPQGYMIDFFGPGYDAAAAMGVLPRVHELSHAIDEACWVDQAGTPRARLSYAQFRTSMRGRLDSLMRPDLERALRESLSDRVDLRFGSRLADVHNSPDGVAVTLDDGSSVEADLLVGADGIHSRVREAVFGPERGYFRYLGMHTAAFLFDDPQAHAEIRGRFCLTDTVNRQMGFYGLSGDTVAVFTAHRTPERTLPADTRTALAEQYGSLGWLAPQALAQCPPADEVYYDLVAQIEMPHWSKDRVTLLGDSCYAVSLLAGQGASLGIAGAYVLAEQLDRAESIESALTRYERIWRPVTGEKQRSGRQTAHWFLPGARWQRRVRRAALALARVPGFSRFVGAALAGKPSTVVTELDADRHRVPTRANSA